MMYIGTSLGRCLQSLLAGKVSEDEVLCIITRTRAPTYERYIEVVKEYFSFGNDYATNPSEYELSMYEWEHVEELAAKLWNTGRIHQPRLYSDGSAMFLVLEEPWLYVSPLNRNANPAVVDAWEKYKMMDELTK